MSIVTEKLRKTYGDVVALKGIDLEIGTGGVVGLLGPNGAGKTTLVEILEGLRQPTSGAARVLGLDPTTQATALKERIGVQLQSTAMPLDLTARELLRMYAAFYDRALPVDDVLARVGLTAKANALNRNLSGGQRQRLALGAATLHEPELLLLDEPTSAVDPQSRRDFWEKLFALVARGTTILVSTHYMDEAERCHRLAILDRGRIAAEGEPKVLAREIDATVIEISDADFEAARRSLAALPEVRSVAQLGNRLRVLLPRSAKDPVALLRGALAAGNPKATVERVGASLEDVFVAATRLREDAVQPERAA